MKPEEAPGSNMAAQEPLRSRRLPENSQIKVDFSTPDRNNGGIDGVVQRLSSAAMSPFAQPAAPSKDYRSASPPLPSPPLPPSLPAQRLQHVESMCAKISDRVAEVQRAINGPHCAACEWKLDKKKKLMCTQSPHLHNTRSF